MELNPDKITNPRNYAAGLLNKKNSDPSDRERLSFVVHGVMKSDGGFERHSDVYKFLERNGVNVIHDYKLCRTSEEVIRAVEAIGASRPELDWALDGAVIKIDQFALRDRLGTTAKAPRWAIAYKFPPELKQTIVREIELNVGRTGKITPVAIFDPITLAGTVVTRATLHNKKYIEAKDIRLGSTIEVYKSGEIIPKVQRVVDNPSGSTPYEFIERCPSCGSKLDMGDWCCVNPNCPAQFEERIIYFVGKNAMDIDGFGANTARKLIELGLIESIADIFTLKRDQLTAVGFGPKESENLIAAIEKSKAASPERILTGLGIREVSSTTAQELIAQFGSLDRISKASFGELHGWLRKTTKDGAQNLYTVLDELGKGDECDLFTVLTRINYVSDKTAKRLLEVFGDSVKDVSLSDLYRHTIYKQDGLRNLHDFFKLLGREDVNPNDLLKLTKLRKVELLSSIDSLDKLDLINGIGKGFKESLKKNARSFEAVKNASLEQLIAWGKPGLKEIHEFFRLIKLGSKVDLVDLVLKIKLIDRQRAEQIRDWFGTFEAIEQASLEDIQKCLWSPVARHVREFFELESNQKLMERLREMGLNVDSGLKAQNKNATSGNAVGSDNINRADRGVIVFTGTLTITRAEAASRAEFAGFTVKNSITKGTKYLVVGDKPGSKLAKAESLGITILNEDQFNEMIDANVMNR